MKINVILFSTCLVAFQANRIIGQPIAAGKDSNSWDSGLPWPANQPSVPLEATNWGKSFQGVQLLIHSTNTVIEAGSSITVLTVITNGSTNVVHLVESSPDRDFDLSLTNAGGRSFHLTPIRPGRSLSMALDGGTKLALNIPVSFVKTIDPGDYILIARRVCGFGAGSFIIESNPLKIQIK
jgi:hypothetical protein